MLMKKRFNKFLTLLAVLLLGFGQMWGADVVHTYEFKNYNSTLIPQVNSGNTKNNVTTGNSFTVSPAEDDKVSTTFYYGAGTTSTTVKNAKYDSSDGVKYSGCGYFVFVLSQSANVKVTTKTITSTWGVDAVTDGAYTWSNFTTVVDGTYATLNNNTETDLGTLAAGRYKFYYGSNSSWAVKKLVITYPSCSTEITTQPSDASLAIGDANPELSIVATHADAYAWKESSDGTSYDGSSTLGSAATFTPSVNDAVQTKYYYCEVTSDCDGTTVVKSDIVTVEVVASIVHVTGVSLDKTSQEFTIGSTTTTTLTATVAPNDATNKAVSWESSAPTKVSVTDNGDGTAEIEALAEGTATITVTTDDGSYTATCNVTVHPDPCSAWGLGTSYNTTPGSGSSTTAGDLTITNIGGVSNSSTTVYSGSGSVKTFTPNSGSKYLTGSLGGSVIESVTVCISTANTGEGQNTADIVFSSAATFDAEKLLNYTGQTYKVHSFVVGTTSDDKGTYTFTAPAGAKSFAVGRNFGFTSDRGGASRASSLSGNRNVYYIQACPHICSGSAATQYAVSGTAILCGAETKDITLAGSQTGAKYVLLKGGEEVASSDKAGTGSALVWAVSEAGTYTVKAIEYGDFCETEMTGSAVITEGTASTITTVAQTVYIGGSLTMELDAAAEGIWASSNPDVATISNAGVVTPVSVGTTNITFTKTGGCVSNEVTITIEDAPVGAYEITYVSAHGTAPVPETAAYVILAELSESGWAHKGWTADEDVTVDAAPVEAGTLIANGKTAILASDVTFTAVWNQIFEVQFNSKGGSEVAKQYIENGGHPTAVADPTKENYVFLGWSETEGGAVVDDITTLTISDNTTLFAKWELDIQITEIVFSNSFKGWIDGSTITAFYIEGESAPTVTSYAGSNLKAEGGVVISGDKIIATGTDDSEKEFDLTMTEVTPLTTTGAKQTFDGSETYVKSAYGWKWHETDASKQKGWAFQKLAADGRIAKGLTREYFFFGPAEKATFTWKVAKKNGSDPAVAYVYVDGVLATTVTSTSTSDPVVVKLKNSNSIVAFESAQTNGDCGLIDVTLTPYVPVESIALKEGTAAISSKEIAEGAHFTLTAEVTPANASNPTIVWESENADIASVADGVVTGVATGGPVNIIARSQDNNTIYATCAVTVAAPCTPATVAWDVEPADGFKGHNGSASVTTNYAAGLEVVSSDPTVASVSNDGVNITINYLKKGSTKITATVVGDGSTYCNTPVSVEKTITVAPDCPVSGNLFTWAYDPAATDITYNLTKTTSTENNDVEVVSETSVVTVSGGQAYLGTTSSTSTATVTDGALAFRLNGNNYAKIVLDCPLQVGDKISYTATNAREHGFYKDAIAGDAVNSVNKQVIINSDTHPLYGAEVLYVKGSNTDSHFKTFSIDRLAPVAGVSLENATVAIGNTITPTMTLLPSNEAYYESIAWSIVGEGEGTIANINAETGEVTALAVGSVTVQVKLNNSESLKDACQVEVVASFDQVDVSEATVWDVTNVSASPINLKDDFSPSKQNERLLLANVPGVNNNASFNSQALMFEGQHIGRVSNGIKHLAGRYVQFNVTVPGAVFVTFASNGSNNRTIRINDKKYEVGSDSETDYKTFAIAVEPGSVEIMGMEGSSENQYVRISKIEFKTGPAYDRTVNPAYLGTLCWKNNAVLVGATLYVLAGKNASNYLVFDEVEGNALEAGKPYIFMPENGNTKIWLYNTDSEAALTTNQDPVNHMYGTIVDTDLYPTTNVNMYYFSSNHIWAVKDFTGVEKITIPAYFCYVDYEAVLAEAPAPAPAPGRRRVTMGVNGKDAAQGFENILGGETPMKVMIDGTLYIIRGEKVFDATGRLVK